MAEAYSAPRARSSSDLGEPLQGKEHGKGRGKSKEKGGIGRGGTYIQRQSNRRHHASPIVLPPGDSL